MKYFFSSPSSSFKILESFDVVNILISYAVDAKKMKLHYEKYKKYEVIIDSGAFSVLNSGKKIDIDEYKDFCLSCPQNWTFVNLDVIPSENITSKKYVEKCVIQGWENFKYLSKYIKNVLPVYHYGEDIKWLKKYRNSVDYIGIGSGGRLINTEKKIEYYRNCFDMIGWDTKVHAFGFSTLSGLLQIPFYSFDSVTYKRYHIAGKMYYAQGDLEVLQYNSIRDWLYYERQLTNVWKERGIIWK